MKKYLFVFVLLFLVGCSTGNVVPLVTDVIGTPTAEVAAIQTEDSILSQAQRMPTIGPSPAPTVVAGLDMSHPYLFESNTGSIDFSSGELITISDDFSGYSRQAYTNAWLNLSPNATWEDALGECGDRYMKIIVFNTQLQLDSVYNWEDTLVFAHSGDCSGKAAPFEAFRHWLEGSYVIADEEQRTERLEEIVGKHVMFGDATFEVVEAAYLSKEELEDAYEMDIAIYGKARFGAVDRFLTKDRIRNHELYLSFCASNGGVNPLDWFSAKYFILLRPVTEK